MPNVLNEFVGDGVTRTFNFSMTGGYLSRDYVFFYTRPNEDLLAYTPYDDDDVTWISDYTVRTATPIPLGTTFVILRSTQLDPLVDFQNTSRITEKNLDTATWQSIHIAAETSDMVGRIQVVATDAKLESAEALLNAQAAADDAVAAANAAIAASQAAGAAQVAALQAGSDAADAALSAAAAASIAAAAESTANAANNAAGAATATAGTALSTANTALSTANTALSNASTAVNTANAATSTANTADSNASLALSTANSATATANNALTIANEAKDLVDEAVAGAVVSFNGRAGVVVPASGDYTKALVGLANVDNTADVDKPLSTAMNNALGLKANTSDVNTALASKANTTDMTNALALKESVTNVNTKLAANATADRNRANHTGYQDMDTITDLWSHLDNPVTQQSVNAGQIAGSRNVVVNGAMMLNHEGPTSPQTTGFHYPVDCFAMGLNLPTGCTVSALKQPVSANGATLPYGFMHAFRLTVATWNTANFNAASNVYAAIQHPIEGNNARRLIDRPFTLSFYVRGSKAGTGYVSFRSGKANRGYTVPFTIESGQNWSRVVITLPTGLPAFWDDTYSSWGDGVGLQVCWTFAASAPFKSGVPSTWVAGNVLMPSSGTNYFTAVGDTVDVTGVQLEVGNKATSFEFESYAQTIQRVNRYVYLCDQVALIRLTDNQSFGGAVATVTLPVRMCGVPAIVVSKTQGDGVGTPTMTAASYGSVVIGVTNMAVGEWLVCSMFAKAYPT